MPRLPAPVSRFVVIVAIYVCGTELARLLLSGPEQVTLIWLPAGLSVTALVLFGRRYWAAILTADVLIGLLSPDSSLVFAPFSAAANTLAAIAAASVVRRFGGQDAAVFSVRTGAALLLAAVLSAAISAPIGVTGLVVSGQVPPAFVVSALGKWFIGNVFGVVLITPALVLGYHAWRHRRMTNAELGYAGRRERLLWLLALVVMAPMAFALLDMTGFYVLGLSGLPLAMLLWSALRMEPLFTAAGSLASGVGLVVAAGLGIAGFGSDPSHVETLVLLLFLSTIAVSPLFLAASSHESRLAALRLREANERLEQRVAERTAELSQSNATLAATLDQLRQTQRTLVEQEKMASLGGVVAGVAHEINTPIGIAITTATHLDAEGRGISDAMAAGNLSRGRLTAFLEQLAEGNSLLYSSLRRASELISSFKQIAVDRSSEQRRLVELASFIGDTLLAVRPVYRHRCVVELDCPPGLQLDTYPGALTQVLTNLLANAATHAFVERAGEVRIKVAERGDDAVQLQVSDNGSGMPADVAARAFEPFFTTRRGSGGTGLGLHVTYNLVTQVLGGSIELVSSIDSGSTFTLTLPRSAPAATTGSLLAHSTGQR